MSPTVTEDVLSRAMSDESFLARFRADPESALDGYDLDPAARDALLTGDEQKIRDVLGEAEAGTTVVVVVLP